MTNTTWTPDQSLRHDAMRWQIMARFEWLWANTNGSNALHAETVAREFAAACVADVLRWAGPNNAEQMILAAESERDRLREQYDLLRRAINTSADDCDDACDSYGHREGCQTFDAAAMLTQAQARANALEAERARLLDQVARMRVFVEIAADTPCDNRGEYGRNCASYGVRLDASCTPCQARAALAAEEADRGE